MTSFNLNENKHIQFIVNPGHDVWEELIDTLQKYEGWQMSIDDYEAYLKAFGPQEFNLIVAIDTKTNTVIGSVAVARFSSINNSQALVPIGYYFVHPEYRKKGLGSELWNRTMDKPFIGGLNRGLCSTESMVLKYNDKHGYKIYTKLYIVRSPIADLAYNNLEIDESVKLYTFNNATKKIKYDDIVNYDVKNNGGINREKFLEVWLTANNVIQNLVAIDENDNVKGFTAIRILKNNSLVFSPLFADTPEIAETLIRRGLELIDDLKQYNYLYFFVPSENPFIRKIILRLTQDTMVPLSTYTIMYTGKILQLNPEVVYSVADCAMCTV